MPANAAARRSCKFGPTVPGGFYINGELDIVVKFAVDSLLEGDGFELVWGFSCQVVVFGFC